MRIRAIPTEYGGYIFRSRTEARWAVFFDLLRIPFRYEVDPYKDTRSGICYLPDFYLPTEGVWIEVKPYDMSEEERDKAHMIVRHPDRRRCLVVFGDPYYPSCIEFRSRMWAECKDGFSLFTVGWWLRGYRYDDLGYSYESVIPTILTWGRHFYFYEWKDRKKLELRVTKRTFEEEEIPITACPSPVFFWGNIKGARSDTDPQIERAMIRARQWNFR